MWLRVGFTVLAASSGASISSVLGANNCWKEIVKLPTPIGQEYREKMGIKLSVEEIKRIYSGELNALELEQEKEEIRRKKRRQEIWEEEKRKIAEQEGFIHYRSN
jgi:hypothetical protein